MAAALRGPANFDPVARLYRWAEYLALGPLLQRVRTHALAGLPPRRFALALGDGDGRFLAALLRRQPQLRAVAVDSSGRMLALLSGRCAFAGDRLQTQQADLHTFAPSGNPDLLVSHFVLDCLSQPALDNLCARLSAGAAPDALWLISDFALPPSPLLRPFAALYIRALYAAFRLLTGLRTQRLPEHARTLRALGWGRRLRREWLGGMLYTEIWSRDYNRPTEDATPMRTPSSTPSMSLDPHHERPADHLPGDALPDPEPAAPSLPQPDPGVFHHEPAQAPLKDNTQAR